MTSPMDATAELEGEQNNLKQNNINNHQMGLKLARRKFFDTIMPT
jgi:hypothetical protein